MATEVIGTGETYTTITSWIASLSATLSSPEVGQLKNQVFTEYCDFSGITTTATNNITLETAAGASFKDNFTPATDALFYNNTLGAAIERSGDYNTVINPADHMVFRGLQIKKVTGAAGSPVEHSLDTGHVHQYHDCIIYHAAGGWGVIGFGGASTCQMVNCLLIVDGTNPAVRYDGSFGTPNFINCGFINLNGTPGDALDLDYSGVCSCINCYAFGFTDWFTATENCDCTNCATDAASINNGTGDSTGEQVSLTPANEVENAANDFRLLATSNLIEAASRQQSFTSDLDIIGQARSTSSPDVGPWEYQSAGGGISVPTVMHHRRMMGVS